MARTHSQRKTVSRFDSLQQEAYLALWRTYDRLKLIEDQLFEKWDLTAQQYNILRLLRGSHPEPVPTLSLVSRLVSRAPDVTRMLDKLEIRSLISRIRSAADRRTVLVGITESGLALLDEIAEPLQQSHRQQLGHLDESELKSLIELLHTVRKPHEPEGSPWQ